MDRDKHRGGKRPKGAQARPPRPAQPGLAARRAAARLLAGVEQDHRLLADLIEDPKGPLAGLPPEDRARAQRLATQTLRHGARADRALAPYLQKAPPWRLKRLLRLATVEICAEGGAAHGVVNAAVALTRADRKIAHLSGLTNAVLRKVAEEVAPNWDSLPPARLPKWLRSPLVATYGPKTTAALEAGLTSAPPLDLTPKDGDATALAAQLGGAALPTGSVRLSDPGQVSALPGYASGDWWVQDAAAAIPARVLGAGMAPGARILDLCAAPGGKSLQLAAQGAAVTALDVSPGRLKRLQENVARTGLQAEIVTADALAWAPEAPFDGILLDAPCSATGTLRRHPDLPLVKTAADIAPLVALQAQLLARAARWLAPGGRLVFCTCSLLPEEGEAHLAAAADLGLTLEPLDPEAFGLPKGAGVKGGLRTHSGLWPERGGMDGFFIAAFGKTG